MRAFITAIVFLICFSSLAQKNLHGLFTGSADSYIFRRTESSDQPQKILSFSGATGGVPAENLVYGDDGFIYGLLQYYDVVGRAVFRVRLDGSDFEIIETTLDKGGFIDITKGTDGLLYILEYDHGYIFKLNPSTKDFIKIYHEIQLDYAQTIAYVNGFLYGTTSHGGASGQGVIFKVKSDGTSSHIIHEFAIADGRGVRSTLVHDNDTNKIIGTCMWGGQFIGVVFEIDLTNDSYKKLHDFLWMGETQPLGKIVKINGEYYGSTSLGGNDDYGVIYKIDGLGNYDIVYHFDKDICGFPSGSLTFHANRIYGRTMKGGNYGNGAMYSFKPDGTDFKVHHHFRNSIPDGNYAGIQGLVATADNRLFGSWRNEGPQAKGNVFEIVDDNETKSIVDFNSIGEPRSIVQLPDGTFYGVSLQSGKGYVFKANESGHNLETIDELPEFWASGTLTVGANGIIVGNGAYPFKIDTQLGRVTAVQSESPVSFDSTKYIVASDRNFYGVGYMSTLTTKITKITKDGSLQSIFYEPTAANLELRSPLIEGPEKKYLYGIARDWSLVETAILYKIGLEEKDFHPLLTFSNAAGRPIPACWVRSGDKIFTSTSGGGKLTIASISFAGEYQVEAEIDMPQRDVSGNFEVVDGIIWGSFSDPISLYNFNITTKTLKIFPPEFQAPFGFLILTSKPDLPEFDPEPEPDPDSVITKTDEDQYRRTLVYPNPAEKFITLETSETRVSRIEIIDCIGRQQRIIIRPGNTIDVSQIDAGFYTLKLLADKRIVTVKFVKK